MRSRLMLVAAAPFALASGIVSMILTIRSHPYAIAIKAAGFPVMLGGEEWDLGGSDVEKKGLRKVTLTYGYPHDLNAPLIEVTTESRQVAFEESESLPRILAGAVKRDEDIRRGEWWKTFEPSPGSPVRPTSKASRRIVIEGQQEIIESILFRDYEAFRFRVEAAVVTVVGRHSDVSGLRFEAADSLRPYYLGYFRFVLSWFTMRR